MSEPGPPPDDWGTPNTPWNNPQQPPPEQRPNQQWQQPPPQPQPPAEWQQSQPSGQQMYGAPQSRPDIKTYLIPAILATVFCCIPTGIASIAFASQVSSKLGVGDVQGAIQSSEKAKLWLIISVVLGLIAGVIVFLSALASPPSSGY